MDAAENMIAVMRTLPDAALAMSILDGNKQLQVLPNTAAVAVPAGTYAPVAVHSVGTEPCSEPPGALSHGAQAVDGRYASVYQMAHCHVHPTSPPVQLTEFPPQRAERSRGQGNFVVGGVGSGETGGSPTRSSLSYRGGMNWPDRSVYTARQSSYHHEPDSFAESLRKYPNMSAERSAEVVERLINYTQMKTSFSKTRSPMSPTRSEAGPGQRCCVGSVRTSRLYEPEVSVRTKVLDESPTRDTCKRFDGDAVDLKKSLFGRNYDVRYIRDVTRRAKETVRNISTYPYNHPVCPPIKERYDHLPPRNYLLSDIISINSVHMETQAEIPMVSKEVTTVPRERPSTRNVAVPLSPSSSQSNSAKLSDSLKLPASSCRFPKTELETKLSHKSIQTTTLTDLTIKPIKSVQTCISSIDIANKKNVKNCRKTKSQEEIRVNDDLEEELIQVIKDLSIHADVDENFCIRNGLLRKLRRLYRAQRSDRVKIKLGRCVRDQLYSHIDFKHFTRELSNELIAKIQASNMFLRCYGSTKVLRTDTAPAKTNRDKCVNDLIKEWLGDIPVKQVDYLGRTVKKEHVLHAVASKIKCLIMNKMHQDRYGSLKSEILDILEDIPVEINSRNRNCYLNRIASDLVRKIKDIVSINGTDRKRWQKAIDLDKTLRNKLKKESDEYKFILPTDNELKQFIKQELKDFITKFNLEICSNTEKEIQIELMDILIDSVNELRYGDDEQTKEEILIMLSGLINISENEGIYFVNNLIYNFKDMLKELHTDDVMPRAFVVLQNTVHSSNQTANHSLEGITDTDINNNLNVYTQQLVEQINEWMESIQGLHAVDEGFKKLVAQDLAGDIVDRHKYLELNPNNKKSDADELEHLKYQIFKWVNKLVGDDNLETLEHASQLMQKIQNIPFPMSTRPAVTVLSVNASNTSFEQNLESYPNEQGIASSPISSPGSGVQYENRRQSCPYAMAQEPPKEERNKCCVAIADTKHLGVMTDSGQQQMRTDNSCCPSGLPLKTAYTETDMGQIPVTCPRGTSMSRIESPKVDRSTNRRFNGPPELSLCTNTGSVEHRPLAAPGCNIDQQNTSTSRSPGRQRPLCCGADPKDPTSTIKELNDDFDHYLQNWVSQIPIITSDPQEQALIDIMRKGIYNGVWKARTKLQMNPDAMENHFYYQDLLDDELEELLDLLPQSSELTKDKQILKNQLIEKINNMNEKIHSSASPVSYKQQLMDNVARHSPRKAIGFAGSDISEVCEDIHKLNIAETYIMYSLYRFRDNVKANVYKKKLMKEVQEFLDNLKRTQGIEAKDLDFKTYKDEIINALSTVPQPGDETMREEGEEVLIGLEIEQWFSDLPLYPTDSNFETLCRKRYRDTLAKKVHDMEKQKNLGDCEEELRHEITRFMGKLPLKQEEIQNMPFMVEELVNRLKNKPKDLVEGSENRKLMPLINPYDYEEFSRDMPLCSSFSNAPGTRRAQVNESSYLIRGGERASNKFCPLAGQYNLVHHRGSIPNSNQPWQTMVDDEPSQARQTCHGPDRSQPGQTMLDDGPSQARQTCHGPDRSQPGQIMLDDGPSQARQTCHGPDRSQPGQTMHDDGPSQARQTCHGPDRGQPGQTMLDDGPSQARQTCHGPDRSQPGQTMHDDGPSQVRQTCHGPDRSQPGQTMHDDRPTQARQTRYGPNRGQPGQSMHDNGASQVRQTCHGPNPNQQWASMNDDDSSSAKQMERRQDSSQRYRTLHDSGAPQDRQTCQSQNLNQQRQPFHNDGAQQCRQGSDSNQHWQSMVSDESRQIGQRRTSDQNPRDCCQFQNVRDAPLGQQSIPRDYSVREPDSRVREPSMRREQSPNTSRLQGTHFSGTCAGNGASPDRRPVGAASQSSPYAARQQDADISGPCGGQATAPNERSLRQLQGQSQYESSPQEAQIPGTCAGTAFPPDRRSSMPASGNLPNFLGNGNRGTFQGNLSPGGYPGNVCPRHQGNQGENMSNAPVCSPVPTLEPEVSTRPYVSPRAPEASQGQFGSHQSPSCFSRQPVSSSTPQQGGPPPRVSRPKKRTRQVERPRRDAARKRLEMTDSEDSGSEEVKCRCMERIWRCRKKKPMFTPCNECDIDFPPCYPMRFPFPYYF